MDNKSSKKSISGSEIGKTLLKAWPYYVLFGVLFVILLLQFLNVGIYYDDYGYYSLNYGMQTVHMGHEYSMSELWAYLGEHYVSISGRLLYFFLWLTLFKIGGLKLVQIAAAVIVTAIFVLASFLGKQETDRKSNFAKAAILCLCFGLIPQNLHQHGTFWFAAFFHYYTPLIPMLLFADIYEKKRDKTEKTSVLTVIILCILILISSWSFESWSVACSVMSILLFAARLVKTRKFPIVELLCFVSSLAGTLLLLKSPGMVERAKDSFEGLDFLHRARRSIAAVYSICFSANMRIFLLVILASACVIGVTLFIQRKGVLDLICAVISGVAFLLECAGSVILGKIILWKWPGLIIGALIIIAVFYPFVRESLRKQAVSKIIVIATGVLSVMALSGVAGFPNRVILPFVVCSFLLPAEAIQLLCEQFADKKTLKAVVLCGSVVAILIPSAFNWVRIAKGYKLNAVINAENERRLIQASDEIKDGADTEEIILLRYTTGFDNYASMMLYQQENNWFNGMITEYYDIPDYVKIKYE